MKTSWFIPKNVPSSKNSKRIIRNTKSGKPSIISSRLTMDYVRDTKWYYVLYGKEFQKVSKNLPFPLNVDFQFIRDSKRTFDYINAAQVVQDLMVENSWVEDDNCNLLFPSFSPYLVDPKEPGVIITLNL